MNNTATPTGSPAKFNYFKVTMPDGSVKMLLDRDRAHGLAGHFGGTVKPATRAEVLEFVRMAFRSDHRA